jgi:predicted transcriptional regulator
LAIENEMLLTLAADIVVAHVSNNDVAAADITGLIENVYGALATLGSPAEPTPQKPKGAVSIRASIKPDHLVSMLDGKPYKMLKRHLALHGYTPQSYREAFDLPNDYPMIAATYAEKRRAIAQQIGLGRKPKAPVEPVVPATPARKPRAKKAAVAPA